MILIFKIFIFLYLLVSIIGMILLLNPKVEAELAAVHHMAENFTKEKYEVSIYHLVSRACLIPIFNVATVHLLFLIYNSGRLSEEKCKSVIRILLKGGYNIEARYTIKANKAKGESITDGMTEEEKKEFQDLMDSIYGDEKDDRQ